MTLTLDRLAEIEAAAAKATPGPRKQAGLLRQDQHWMREVRMGTEDQYTTAWLGANPAERAHKDAAFIAACDPQTVIALVKAAKERYALIQVIKNASAVMGGKGVEDQGEAWDRCLRILDDALRDAGLI